MLFCSGHLDLAILHMQEFIKGMSYVWQLFYPLGPNSPLEWKHPDVQCEA